MALVGGVRDSEGVQNSVEIEGLAKFAVEEHNNKENALLEFVRVVKAKEQVVAGTMHHLTLEAIDAGKEKIYEAKVWVKPWENFKQLQEFKHAGDCPAFTSSDLGVKQDSTALMGNVNAVDWQEEAYQKVKSMKEMYYPELSDMYQKICVKSQQPEYLSQQSKGQVEKMKMMKMMLERTMTFLQVSKSSIPPSYKEKLLQYEKGIVNFLTSNRSNNVIIGNQYLPDPGQQPPIPLPSQSQIGEQVLSPNSYLHQQWQLQQQQQQMMYQQQQLQQQQQQQLQQQQMMYQQQQLMKQGNIQWQQPPIRPSQFQIRDQLLSQQQQLQQQMMNLHIQSSHIPSHIQQQQNLLQSIQMQSSQHSHVPSSVQSCQPTLQQTESSMTSSSVQSSEPTFQLPSVHQPTSSD